MSLMIVLLSLGCKDIKFLEIYNTLHHEFLIIEIQCLFLRKFRAMHIDSILDRIYTIPKSSKEKIRDLITEISLPKGFLLMEAGKRTPYLYFVKKGIVRAYSIVDDSEVTFWFGSEGETILSMRSYVDDKTSYESIELLEDCDLYRLKSSDLQKLYETDIQIANWGRKYAEKELMKTEEIFISRQFKTASERYKDLLKTRPELLQRVSLGNIASYLGITQVSLSRIRTDV